MGIFGESKQDIINRYENLLKNKQSQIDQLTNDITLLKNRVKSSADLLVKISNEKENEIVMLKTKNQSFSENIEDLKSVLDEKAREIISGKNNEKLLSDENEHLKRILKENEKEIYSLKNTNKLNFEKIGNLKKSINEKDNELEKLKQDISDSENIILCAGRYKGERDIPAGEYDLVILSGCGMVETNKPEDVYFWMSDDPEERREYNYTDKYSGLEISENTTLKISKNAKIRFAKKKEYSYEYEKTELYEEYRKKKQGWERKGDWK